MKSTLTALFIYLSFCHLYAQDSLKRFAAVRSTTSIKIDGQLTEQAWKTPVPASDFIVYAPNFGESSANKTEVYILYDDNALYVGARLYDDPKLIRKQLTARDASDLQDVDAFSVFFDTYNDRQNGFMFSVSSRNVQTDGKIMVNSGNTFGAPVDKSWDAVWQSMVSIDNDGWTVEMRIPFFSLRFVQKETQDWGFNISRYKRSTNETSYWNSINPNVAGFTNQFGYLANLKNIRPPLRLSFLPYVTGGFRTTPTDKGRRNEFLRNGGMDVKWGLNESFTLDMTLIPDFGQVVSDNVVNNVSPFEVQFTENRPFFTEGTEIFNKAGLFYSRRVGAIPSGYYAAAAAGETDSTRIVKNPGVVQLYNATKFSGRTKGKLGIGIFNAVGAATHAVIENTRTGAQTNIETSPLTNYNIIVLDQALKNRSSITFTNASTLRSGPARDANVTSLDASIFNSENTYGLQTQLVYSSIKGSNPHNGFKSYLGFGKVSGRFQFNVGNNIESDKYDPNDLGILQAPNEFVTVIEASYSQRTPTRHFNQWSYTFGIEHSMLFKPFNFSNISYNASAFWFFKNFWDVTFITELNPEWKRDYFELRTPGRMIRLVPWGLIGMNGSTDSRKKLFVRLNAYFTESAALKKDPYLQVNPGFRYRFNDHLSVDVSHRFSKDYGQIGYAFLRETNGEPIAARRQHTEGVTIISGIYSFTSRMNVNLRARHYWNKLSYVKFYQVDKDGYWLPYERAFIPGQDVNFNTWNFDMFFTWDFNYGSRFVLGYKNWLADGFEVDGTLNKHYLKNANNIFSLPHGNELTARLIWFIDYNRIKRK